MAIRSHAAFSKSVPVHLLSHGTQPSVLQQHRYRSTFLLKRTYITRKPLVRPVFTSGTHRYKLYNPPDSVCSRENVERKRRVQTALLQAASRIVRRASFATRELRARGSDRKRTKIHWPTLMTTRAGFTTTGLQQEPTSSRAKNVPSLSHLTTSGQAHMIDVGHKKVTWRSASAVSHVIFSSDITYRALTNAEVNKGDAVAVSRIAGIQAAKKAADLIPLAHPSLTITAVRVDIRIVPTAEQQDKGSTAAKDTTSVSDKLSHMLGFDIKDLDARHGCVQFVATVECWGKTGIEMEALTAANVAALTMFDMLKGIDKNMSISQCRVIEKKGGKSGTWSWNSKSKQLEQTDHVDSSPQATAIQEPETHKPYDRTKPEPKFTPTTTTAASAFPASSIYVDGDEYNVGPTASTSPTKINSISTSTEEEEESNAQSIFEAEWAHLTDSFTKTKQPNTTPQPSITSYNQQLPTTPDLDSPMSTLQTTHDRDWNVHDKPPSDHGNEDTADPEIQQWRGQYTQDMLEGANYNNHVDSRAFHRARVERYEAWKKSR